jgi:AAA domain-containing protein
LPAVPQERDADSVPVIPLFVPILCVRNAGALLRFMVSYAARRTADPDFILEMIVSRMPYENHNKVFDTFVDWARFGELFAYDETAHRITLLR